MRRSPLPLRVEADLLETRGVDRQALSELRRLLDRLGLRFGMRPSENGEAPAAPESLNPVVLAELEEAVRGCPVLLVAGEAVLARFATLWDAPAFAVSPPTAERLSGREVAVRVPLSERAREECRALPERVASASRVASGWLTEILLGTGEPSALVRGAIAGEVDPLEDPLARMAPGLRPD